MKKYIFHVKILFFFLFIISTSSQTFCEEIITEKGSVTGLNIPRFVSLKKNKANIRRGPGISYKIDWTYNVKGLPLEIFAEYGVWRKIRDFEGESGWVHSKLLSGKRTVLFYNEAFLRKNPSVNSKKIALINKNVIGELIECEIYWCKVKVEKKVGWAFKNYIWGVIKD